MYTRARTHTHLHVPPACCILAEGIFGLDRNPDLPGLHPHAKEFVGDGAKAVSDPSPTPLNAKLLIRETFTSTPEEPRVSTSPALSLSPF